MTRTPPPRPVHHQPAANYQYPTYPRPVPARPDNGVPYQRMRDVRVDGAASRRVQEIARAFLKLPHFEKQQIAERIRAYFDKLPNADMNDTDAVAEAMRELVSMKTEG